MSHEYYMQLALDLARKGWPAAAPNPMVGCVIVRQDQLVASGYHEQFGGPHAEVVAIGQLPADVLPGDCTLYVTLEPCSHFGKTPPCADLLISKGFKKVVIAMADPNPLVSGGGILKLQQAGTEVITGILEKEARSLNKRFVTFFENQRPYYILKWAQTADGFVSRLSREQDLGKRIARAGASPAGGNHGHYGGQEHGPAGQSSAHHTAGARQKPGADLY